MVKILVSCLVLNGSKSGYRRIIKNMIEASVSTKHNIDYLFIISGPGLASLGLDPEIDYPNVRVVNTPRSKYFRVLFEQIFIPLYALIYNAEKIFMPATFGLCFPIRETTTFVHTNTMFILDRELQGVSRFQGVLQRLLVKITYYSSHKLLFTTRQTYKEHTEYCGKKFPERVLGNGLKPQNTQVKSKWPYQTLPSNFILTVSQFYRLKQQNLVVKLFKELKEDNIISCDVELVLVGTIQEQDYFDEIVLMVGDRDDIRIFHALTDEHLSTLFKACASYVFLSSFEGYSLTPAEALLNDKPILLSNIPTHKEVYGELANFADIADERLTKSNFAEFMNNDHEKIDKDVIRQKFSFDAFMSRLADFLLE